MKEHRPLGWTTIEEAKLLVEAGLDPNTADMSYNFVVCKVINGNPSEDWLLQPFSPDENQPHKQLPCWSLGSLIELMPKEIRINYLYALNIFTTYRNKYCVSYHSIYKNIYAESESTLIESVVNCVIWLIQNGYIKKSE